MRCVRFSPQQLDPEARAKWYQLQQRAAGATDAMVGRYRANQPPNPNQGQAIWAEIKRFLLEYAFERKCAYCEANTDANAPQHAEHWRPKNEVKDPLKGGTQVIGPDGHPHPGYWWLALNWDNLAPACYLCNSGNGKGSQFPIAGDYVFSPEEVPNVDSLDEKEHPLLLHPFRGDTPEDHIRFQQDGFVAGITDKGRWTLKVLDLNRQALVDARLAQIKAARNAIKAAVADVLDDRTPEDTIDTYTGPRAQFSRAVYQVLLPRLKAVGQLIAGDG